MAMSRRSGQKAVRRFNAREWASCRCCRGYCSAMAFEGVKAVVMRESACVESSTRHRVGGREVE